MRGKRSQSISAAAVQGITPADAGKTTTENVSFVYQPDHPRGCGENSFAARNAEVVAGSPPRMRGKQHPQLQVLCFARITPADAGKTFRKAFTVAEN